MSKEKTATIRIISGCRVSGKDLDRGKTYSGIALDDAKFAVSAGRAVYCEAPVKKAAKKAATK